MELWSAGEVFSLWRKGQESKRFCRKEGWRTRSEMLGIVGALLLGGAVFYIVYSTQVAALDSAAKERLGVNWGSDDAPFRPPFYLRFTRPLLQGPYLDVAVGFWKPEQLAAWKQKIRAAGLHRNIEPEHFVAAKFWMTLAVGLLMFLFVLFGDNPPPPWFAAGMTVLAFFLPNIHLSGLQTARQQAIRLSLPYVMDLMTLSMEAGLEFMGAIARVVERAPTSPLLDEMAELLKDIQLGKSRSEALRKMAQGLDMTEITSLVAVLVSADQMGVSIGPVLRAQADTIRAERLVKAEKLGAQASQKILLPLVFFILPAVMLVIFAPLVLGLLGVK